MKGEVFVARFNKHLMWWVLASVGATLTGCGTSNLATRSLGDTAQNLPTIKANGQEFVLGFDDARYAQVANKVAPVTLPHLALLPPSADNRANCSPVANQGHLGSCTAFSSVKGFREFLQRHDHEDTTPLAPLFMYYESRYDKEHDTGSTLTDCMEVLDTTGVAPEATWPYDITKFALKPPAEAYTAAKKFQYHHAIKLGSFADVQTALSKGYVVPFGFDVYASFKTIGKDGLMPVPKPGEQRLGGHAVVAVGYDNQKQLVTVRNSWGEAWADQGYFYMPYSVFKTTARDMWSGDFRSSK